VRQPAQPRIAIVSGPRSPVAMGLELAERRLLAALRDVAEDLTILGTRVVGGRSARRHARAIGGRWVPAPPARPWYPAWRRSELVHLIGLDLPPPRQRPFVATIHDVSPLVYDDEGSMPPWFDEVLERAALMLTPSAFTAGELTRRCGVAPERIRVFGAGPAHETAGAPPLSDAELEELGIRPPFVLRSGGYTLRKNVPLLLEAWRGTPGGTLVLVGPPQVARTQIVANAERVVILDYVPASLLVRLVRSAAAVASPSLYEGFGLPPLEALAAGTPVVAVRTPFAEEVCGDAALLVEPEVAALRDGLVRVMSDERLAQRLRAAGPAWSARFTWHRAAERVLSAYAEVLER
jgi:glycosyltransferase involved in cell wall biosynthesis